jgi:NAD(P)-dependent dehydrogenase (short-subunit alcohol dehydrogenase family)
MIEANGDKAIGVDIKDCQVIADLSTRQGREEAVEKVTTLTDGLVDAVIANAGLGLSIAKTVSVNFFGAIEFIEGMRPALLKSKSPRVVATSSMASLMPNDAQLVDLMLAGNEAKAVERAQLLVNQGGGAEALIYGSSKRALSRWIRRECIKPEWAGAGIPMNAVGPGIVKTPMVSEMIATPESREYLAKVVPMPLNGYIEPEEVAALILWLASETNAHTTGQTIYIDGGSDAVIRGENIWT